MTNMPDFSGYTDEKLDQARRLINIESATRGELQAIPGQIRELAKRYRELGGEPADLSLEPPAESE